MKPKRKNRTEEYNTKLLAIIKRRVAKSNLNVSANS